MNRPEKERFAETFVEKYLAQGFGSLPKSEIDLLVFHLLQQIGDYSGKTNYQLSTLLKIPEPKIKSLRLNSALKYKKINSKAVLSEIVLRLINNKQVANFDSGKVEISLEDPIEKKELINFLKIGGYHAEYTLNSEVLKISTVRLFQLIVENLEDPEKSFNDIVQTNIQDAKRAEELTNKALDFGQKFEEFRKEALSAGTMISLISDAAKMLASALS